VNETNEADLWAYMYLKQNLMNVKKDKTKRKRLFRFKIGQLVRISHQRQVFIRVYNEQWCYEVFKIETFPDSGHPDAQIGRFVGKRHIKQLLPARVASGE